MEENAWILVRDLEVKSAFRSFLTDRVGVLREKEIHRLRVTWRDGGGPRYIHPYFRAEPWPREEKLKLLDKRRGE